MAADDGDRTAGPFWRTKALQDMTSEEWESLCDRCGLCCQIRLEDEDSGEIALSDVACRFLDLCTHRCKDYANRQTNVPDCVKVTPANVHDLTWLPHSCAYRLIAGGNDLPDWHHLLSGDRDTVHRDGPSMRGELVGEDEVDWRDYGASGA